MTETIPDLDIASTTDGLIELQQQNGFEDPDCIRVHPMHIRVMAEKLGLIDQSDPISLCTVRRLQRQMVLLRNRIEHLDDWLSTCSDHREDLTHEVMLVEALKDLVSEFTADFREVSASCHADTVTSAPPSGIPSGSQAESRGTTTGRTRPAANQMDLPMQEAA